MPEVIRIDPKTSSDELLTKMWGLYDVLNTESHPGEPMTPLAQQMADWRSEGSEHQKLMRWVVEDDGEIVATAVIFLDLGQNLDNGFCRISVHPDHRERGHCRLLAKPVFDELEAAHRHRIDTWVVAGTSHAGLPERLGMKGVYSGKESQLKISNLDMDLLDGWIERAEERASDYELMFVDSPLPEEIIEDFCNLAEVMNTAPREDYEQEDEEVTPARMRGYEKQVHDAGGQLHHCVAVHKPTGDYAGYTTIRTKSLEPDAADQWDTGVDPEHRNKGLGRWLKAANIKDVVERFPEVERVTTDNAGSNAPMLNINIEMGFRPLQSIEAWQGDLATARERLGV